MPPAPLPPELEAFLAAPRQAVIATVRSDGSPSTAATWYDWRDGRIVLSMDDDGARSRNLRRDPRFSLTVLADDWYHHVTVYGHIVEIRPDPDLVLLDVMSFRYTGEPYERTGTASIAAFGVVDRWYVFGSPA